ncbi:hypothetical protein [Stappia sp. BW2]|uniref:hypothetical protein n=1 Tax=Stappia sp. BW2 TaxID=2592622 RepID=UPI001294260B|nr:hypothetical protein [Stappia sp. BW2]
MASLRFVSGSSRRKAISTHFLRAFASLPMLFTFTASKQVVSDVIAGVGKG